MCESFLSYIECRGTPQLAHNYSWCTMVGGDSELVCYFHSWFAYTVRTSFPQGLKAFNYVILISYLIYLFIIIMCMNQSRHRVWHGHAGATV